MAIDDIHPCPPRDGSTTVLPGFLDFHVRHNPDRPYVVFPNRDPTSYDHDHVTYKEFADASHRVAYAVRPVGSGHDGAVIAMLIDCDTLLYHTISVGLIRAGLVPFPMYTRLAPIAVASMMQRVDCHRLLYSAALKPLIDGVRAALPAAYALQADLHPAFVDIFPSFSSPRSARECQPYPPPSGPRPPSDITLYLHSSGTTGLPKPIPQTALTLLHWCSSPIIAKSREHGVRWAAAAAYATGVLGLGTQLLMPLVSGLPSTIFPPREHLALPPVTPTQDNTIDAARRTGATGIGVTPWGLDAWAKNDEHVAFLASLKIVMYSGGSLTSSTGDTLVAAGVHLCCVYAATEFGPVTDVFDVDDGTLSSDTDVNVKHSGKRTREEYAWMRFSSTTQPRWVPHGKGTYELHLMTCPTHQPSVENLGNEKGYATSDLWVPHPTKAKLWRLIGRADSVIVLNSGWNYVPIPQEDHLCADPRVSAAVIFCREGHSIPGVLVEPSPEHAVMQGDKGAVEKFIDAIWQQIVEANEGAPDFGRIYREMIIVADPGRPVPRSYKGTIQRKIALMQYAQDIDLLYERVDVSKLGKLKD